jgi:hypothetical protein
MIHSAKCFACIQYSNMNSVAPASILNSTGPTGQCSFPIVKYFLYGIFYWNFQGNIHPLGNL